MDSQYLTQIDGYINGSIETKHAIINDLKFKQKIVDVAELCLDALGRGNKIIFAGNGGSAGDSQHIAAEFVSRFEFDRPGLSSISLTTDTSMLTAIGNDYGYEQVFSRQLQANGRKDDVFIGITTSGKSPNIISALSTAKELGIKSVAFTGNNKHMDGLADVVLNVPSAETARIQESHIMIGHCICGVVERKLFG